MTDNTKKTIQKIREKIIPLLIKLGVVEYKTIASVEIKIGVE